VAIRVPSPDRCQRELEQRRETARHEDPVQRPRRSTGRPAGRLALPKATAPATGIVRGGQPRERPTVRRGQISNRMGVAHSIEHPVDRRQPDPEGRPRCRPRQPHRSGGGAAATCALRPRPAPPETLARASPAACGSKASRTERSYEAPATLRSFHRQAMGGWMGFQPVSGLRRNTSRRNDVC
jgi:hypothetical protein